jgi:hypothetical protein
MGESLGQCQRTHNAGERFSGISEKPFGQSTDILGADTGIMSAVNKTMGRILLWIVEKAPGIGVLSRFCLIPGRHPGRPSAMMRLEPQPVISLLFGHPEQPLGERPGGGYATGHRCCLPHPIERLKPLPRRAALLGKLVRPRIGRLCLGGPFGGVQTQSQRQL